MEKWVVTSKKSDFKKTGIEFGIDPVVARLIHNRDIVGNEAIQLYLHGTLQDLPSVWQMKDMELCVNILREKIQEKKKIRVLGDYDIDGVMATYILVTGLEELGAQVDTCIPDRIQDGYGIHQHLIDQAIAEGVDTILTCDNGISARDEISYAKAQGLTVLVTDHHDIPFEESQGERKALLPPADAILNPKQPGCPYPYKNLCGAVIAFKLILALYERMEAEPEKAMAFLEYAAFATIGDVMELTGENRILVKEGLKALNKTQNEGLRQLILVNHLDKAVLSPYHIGFVLGPCINASGRLETARLSLELLQEKDPAKAKEKAEELHELNKTRQELTEAGKEQALAMVREGSFRNDRVLVLFLEDCQESIAGIIAGRVREAFHRPCFIITRGKEDCKGSGRSIEDYAMSEELGKCQDLLVQFGGHPMAAGLTIKEENIPELRRRLNENCRLTAADLADKIVIDAAMPIAYISKWLVNQIHLLEPFGNGNPRPLFAQKDLHAIDARIVGRNHNAVKLRLGDAHGVSHSAVYFGDAQKFIDEIHVRDRLAVTYYPEINVYQGRENLQIIIQNYKVY